MMSKIKKNISKAVEALTNKNLLLAFMFVTIICLVMRLVAFEFFYAKVWFRVIYFTLMYCTLFLSGLRVFKLRVPSELITFLSWLIVVVLENETFF